jgi:hypothetical protein
MSGPLDVMKAGTTLSDSVAPAGERPNKKPIFVSEASDTRGFRTWLRTHCPNSLSAQLKAEKLTIVPGTAVGLRATMSVLRSLDGSKGVSFHTFSLPEDRQVRLLIKNLGRQMPESVVRQELEDLGICVQGVMQLRSRCRDLDASKDRPLIPHFTVSVARGPGVQKVPSFFELCSLRVSVEKYVAPKGSVQCKRCQRFGHTQRNSSYPPRCVACGDTHKSGECSTPQQQLKSCSCGGNHTANYRGCSKWKEAKAALAKQVPKQRTRTSGANGQPAANKVVMPQPSAEQESLGSGWNNIVRVGRVVKATLPTPPEPAPRSVIEIPQKEKMTEVNTGWGNTANPVPKATKALRQAQVTRTIVKSGKSSPKNPNPTKPITPPQFVTSHVEAIYSWARVWN